MAATDGQPPPTTATRMKQPRIDALQTQLANLAVGSPVNQNGSFEFDRVIKAGSVLKRTRKTKKWRPSYIVLRPNILSIYKSADETGLRHQINLADLTAVARQKDSNKKKENVFGLFSPARNFHLSAPTEKDAQEWVDLIRTAARIDREDEEMILLSPSGNKTTFSGFGTLAPRENVVSSSSEAEPSGIPAASAAIDIVHGGRRPSHALNYSGNEHGSFSDFSDTGGPVHAHFQRSSASLPRPLEQHNASQVSNLNALPDDERVIYHGWLYLLKSKGGVRQWKKVWVVLRPKSLGLYKNEEEYSANLIIPFPSIIDAVEIDPASKSKKYCMQVITEEKNFRFCAPDEDSLARCLGAFKSILAKRKESELQRAQQPAHNSAAPSSTPKNNPLTNQQPIPLVTVPITSQSAQGQSAR